MLLLFIILALMQPAALLAQSASLAVSAGSTVKPVDVDRGRGNAVFSLSALEPLGGRVENTPLGARLTLLGEMLTFENNSPFFRAGNRAYQLIAPARRSSGSFLVSTQLITEWLPQHFAGKLTYRNGVLSNPTITATLSATAPPKPPQNINAPAKVSPTPQTAPSPAASQRVVVIDAGHGGNDYGKVGPNGLPEKVVTLTVATKLAALLKDAGYEVHLTRATDTLISLADRPKFANQWKNGRPATLFVSIHANAGAAQARGFETYFLSEARTDDERRVAEMENAAIAFEDHSAKGPAIEQLLTGLRNDYYQHASNDLAEVIQSELGAFHPGPSRGVKQAGFRVLVGAVMPAVLVEIAFMSNPGESQLLGTAAFQEKIAWSLARSIGTYFDSHQHLWQTGETGQ